MNTLNYSDAKQITPNFAQLIDKAAVLPIEIQEEIILQQADDIENEQHNPQSKEPKRYRLHEVTGK